VAGFLRLPAPGRTGFPRLRTAPVRLPLTLIVSYRLGGDMPPENFAWGVLSWKSGLNGACRPRLPMEAFLPGVSIPCRPLEEPIPQEALEAP